MNRPEENSQQKSVTKFLFGRIRETVLLFSVVLICGYMLMSCSKEVTKLEVPEPGPSPAPLVKINSKLDFTAFKHDNPQHDRLPCSYCHVRKDNSPTPKLPEHLKCAGCHVEQFADKQNGICSVCHTGPDTAALKSFPPLRNFNARFEHARHKSLTNCATCHKPSQNGKAISIPTRSNSHVSCFQCHTSEKQFGTKNIGSCQTCHQAGSPPPPVSESARAYSVGFRHSDHKQNCTACHNVKSGAGRGKQVTAFNASMHFPPRGVQSCASCHNNKTAFGGDDFSDCRRCHSGSSYAFP